MTDTLLPPPERMRVATTKDVARLETQIEDCKAQLREYGKRLAALERKESK